jgi:hypothetical protein
VVAAEFPRSLRDGLALAARARRNGRSLSAELRRAAAAYLELDDAIASRLLEGASKEETT